MYSELFLLRAIYPPCIGVRPLYNRLPLCPFEQGIGRESLLITTFTLSPIKQFWRLFYAASLIRTLLSCNVFPDDMPPRDGAKIDINKAYKVA